MVRAIILLLLIVSLLGCRTEEDEAWLEYPLDHLGVCVRTTVDAGTTYVSARAETMMLGCGGTTSNGVRSFQFQAFLVRNGSLCGSAPWSNYESEARNLCSVKKGDVVEARVHGQVCVSPGVCQWFYVEGAKETVQ